MPASVKSSLDTKCLELTEFSVHPICIRRNISFHVTNFAIKTVKIPFQHTEQLIRALPFLPRLTFERMLLLRSDIFRIRYWLLF